MGSGSKAQTVGYEYSMGVHLALCNGPIDEVTELIVGERSAWTGSVTGNSTITINQPNLFGGKNREGGLIGQVDFCFGAPDQAKNPYLASLLNPVPAYRGLATVVFRGGTGGGFTWSSMNPYFKAPWWRMRRILKGWSGPVWYPEKARIGQFDMNGAHIIYECLTNTDWGMGYQPGDIDDTSFRAAADTLYAENFGLSLMWMDQTSIDDFIQMIINHIDGALRTDIRTGKFMLRLIRNDYVVANLPTLDEDNVLELTSFQRVAWGDTSNEMVVTYYDRDQNETSVTLQDLAGIAAEGRIISATREYLGARDADTAARLGQRDLNLVSSPLSKITVVTNRTTWAWDMTDVFKFVWPRLGLNGVPYRIVKIDKGELANGQITIEAVEDVFGMPLNAYVNNQPQGWDDTVKPPLPVAAAKIFEAPYYDIVQAFSAADIAYFPAGYAYGEVAALRPTRATMGYELYAGNNPGTLEDEGSGEFTGSATIPNAIARGAVPLTMVLNNGFDLDLDMLGTYAYIDDEAFKVADIIPLTGQVTLERGVIDTVPAAHAAGARVWFVDQSAGYDPTQRTQGETAYYKMLTRTGMGTLPLASATAYQKTFVGRAERPYPPGNVQINGQYFPAAIVGGMTVTWAHRSRLQQTAGLNDFRTGSIGPEAGTTYQIQVYDGLNLKRTYNAIAGTSWTYPMADAILDGTLKTVRFVSSSVRGGLTSWQQHDITVDRYGFGFRFGENFGGAIPA